MKEVWIWLREKPKVKGTQRGASSKLRLGFQTQIQKRWSIRILAKGRRDWVTVKHEGAIWNQESPGG
jgi:hypothetical protein